MRLEVHHLTYEHFGDELPEEIVVLCEKCHAKADEKRRHAMQMERHFNHQAARRTAWAAKVYGDAAEDMDADDLEERFSEWLDRRGLR